MDNERERTVGTDKKLNAMEEKTIYMVTGFQLIYGSGIRDNVKLNEPEFTEDVEGYRKSVTEKHGCMSVNLTYVEIGKGKFSNF